MTPDDYGPLAMGAIIFGLPWLFALIRRPFTTIAWTIGLGAISASALEGTPDAHADGPYAIVGVLGLAFLASWITGYIGGAFRG